LWLVITVCATYIRSISAGGYYCHATIVLFMVLVAGLEGEKKWIAV